MKGFRVFIAGGGTGGHLYPALSIAQKLKSAGCEIHFIGTKRGLEKDIIPKAGFPLHYLRVGGFNKTSILRKLTTLIELPVSFVQSLYYLIKYRPKFILGIGGYSSGPVLLAATILCKKRALFEPNAFPGVTNRILSYFVKDSYIVFPGTEKRLKSEHQHRFGFPIRKAMLKTERAEEPKLRILVFGGSQGARAINETVCNALVRKPQVLDKIELVHQTGKLDFTRIQTQYGDLNVNCKPYLDPMADYYKWADLVFCRAGASTVSELAACGKAAVLIPFPFAADNHQQKNAEEFSQREAAKMVLQKDFTEECFIKTVEHFYQNREDLKKFEKNISQLYVPNAAEKIASHIQEMVNVR